MKKLITSALSIIAMISISTINQSCSSNKIKGNGNIITRNNITTDYDEIKVYGNIDVNLFKGNEGQINVTTDENIQEYIEINSDNRILTLKIKDNTNLKPKKGILINVPFDDISKITLEGSGEIKSANNITGDNLNITLNGSGEIELPVETSNTQVTISGSGDINLKGSTNTLDVYINGSGDFEGYKLDSKNTTANIDGSGNAEVVATKKLIATVKGSGDIEYKGNPDEKEIKTSGSGDVKAN